MAPKAAALKATRQEKAWRLQKKSQQLAEADSRLAIQRMMKEKPHLLHKLKDFLEGFCELGTPGVATSVGLSSGSASRAPSQPPSGGGGGEGSSASTGGGAHEGSNAGTPLKAIEDDATSELAPAIPAPHKNFTRVSNMPLVHIKKWLGVIEPIAFSHAQLSTMIPRGSREVSRQALAELLGFTVGIDPEQPLFEAGRSESELKTFTAHLRAKDLEAGRRGRDLELPPVWDRDGYYTIVVVGSLFHLKHSLSNTSIELPAELVAGAQELSDLVVVMNYSEARACITGPGPMKYIQVAELMKTSGVPMTFLTMSESAHSTQTPKKKRDRLAIADRVAQFASPDPPREPSPPGEADAAAGAASASGGSAGELGPVAEKLLELDGKRPRIDDSDGEEVPPPPPAAK